MATGKIIALTIQTSVGKVMSFLFNVLSWFTIAFLPRSKQSYNCMAAVTISNDFGAQKNKIFLLLPLFLHLFAIKSGYHDLSFVCFVLFNFEIPLPQSQPSCGEGACVTQ